MLLPLSYKLVKSYFLSCTLLIGYFPSRTTKFSFQFISYVLWTMKWNAILLFLNFHGVTTFIEHKSYFLNTGTDQEGTFFFLTMLLFKFFMEYIDTFLI